MQIFALFPKKIAEIYLVSIPQGGPKLRGQLYMLLPEVIKHKVNFVQYHSEVQLWFVSRMLMKMLIENTG